MYAGLNKSSIFVTQDRGPGERLHYSDMNKSDNHLDGTRTDEVDIKSERNPTT